MQWVAEERMWWVEEGRMWEEEGRLEGDSWFAPMVSRLQREGLSGEGLNTEQKVEHHAH